MSEIKLIRRMTPFERHAYEQGVRDSAEVSRYHYADLIGVEKYTKAGVCESVANAILSLLEKSARGQK